MSMFLMVIQNVDGSSTFRLYKTEAGIKKDIQTLEDLGAKIEYTLHEISVVDAKVKKTRGPRKVKAEA